jgi:AcrR family transcriptional regulator
LQEQPPRRGRRPGQTDSKAAILEAARRLFVAEGYGQTTIRAVAEQAGVDSALVMHFFSSKDGLFRAAIEWPVDMDEAARRVFDGDAAGFGERLARMVCEVWEDETTRHPLTVILRNAVQREDAARMASEFMQRELVGRIRTQAQDPSAALRAGLAHSALTGMVMARYVIGVEPLASAPRETVVRVVGSTIQRYLTGDIEL